MLGGLTEGNAVDLAAVEGFVVVAVSGEVACEMCKEFGGSLPCRAWG